MNLWDRIKFSLFKSWFKEPKVSTVDTLNQAIALMSPDSEINKLFVEFSIEASKPDRDQAKLDLIIFQAKYLDATFEYTVEPDGTVETKMACQVQLNKGSLYFDKKQKSIEN